MENSDLRNPVQKRAIEKKNRILEYGFKLMCENGYHNIDCIEIAKSANVSTGTVYQYFTDKRDIFLQGLKNDAKEKLFPIIEFKDRKIEEKDLYKLIKKFIDISINTHSMSPIAHEEIMAMKHSDPDVKKIIEEYEQEAISALVTILQNNNFEITTIYEKTHLILNWIDDLCHEIIYHNHTNINYDVMTDIVVNSIINLLK